MSPKVSDQYKEERRSLILDTALACFTEKGYRYTTIEDIARRLSMSKGSIYLYFSTKEEIYTRIMQERMRRTVERLRSRFGEATTARGKLDLVFQTFGSQNLAALQQILAFHLEFWLESVRRPELREAMEEQNGLAIALLSDIVQEGVANGEFRRDADPAAAASLFWAARDGIALQFVGAPSEAAYRERMEGLEDFLLRYLH